MHYCRKIPVLFILLALLGPPVFALEISGQAPHTGDSGLNGALNNAFTELLGQINEDIKGIDDKPKDFIQAWADSSIFASQGAAQRGYQGYKLFDFTIGPAIGLRLPGSDPFSVMNDLDDIANKLNETGDIKLGMNAQAITGQLGINTSFLVKGLYLGVRFGLFNLPDYEGLSFNTWSFGVTGNYQLIKPISLLGLIKWRGVSLGTGMIYQSTKLSYGVELEDQQSKLQDNYSGTLAIKNPKISFDMDTGTFLVPLEVTTALRVLILNLTLGVGVDLGFGKTDMTIKAKGDIAVEGLESYNETDPGYLSLTAGGDMSPHLFNPKLMAGLGLTMGPIMLDVPVTFYIGNGMSAGITLGFSL